MRALVMPDRVMSGISTVLSRTGASITEEPLEEKLAKSGFLAIFRCRSDDGVVVWLKCQKAGRYGVFATIESPWPGLRRLRDCNRWAKKIRTALLEAGAMTPKQARENIEH
jgi:hypothetical protein